MWTKRIRLLKNRRGAAILAFALTLTLIAALGAVLMARTLIDQKRLNERRRELWRAFLHAESGIAQVQHWAFYPDSFTPDTDLFYRDPDGDTAAEKYPNLQAALNAGGIVVDESELDSMGLTGFTTESGWELGRIQQIRLRPLGVDAPFVRDPITGLPTNVTADPPNSTGTFFKIITVGEASNGVTREVIGYATLTPVVEVELPAPLISLVTATAFGNAKVHWGEAWSKSNFDVLNNSQLGYALSDPLVKWRTEAAFNFPNNWGWRTTYQANRLYTNFMNQSTAPNGRQPGLFPTGNGDWKDVFYQNVPVGVLDWPDLASQYQDFKDMAIANNRYYTTNSSGDILKDGQVVQFYDEFTVLDRANAPMELAFIDTTDQNPPAADGSNLATIHVSGNSEGLKAFFYVCANFDGAGIGSPPSLTAVNPNTAAYQSLNNIFLDGVIYAAGTIELSGNAGVYGSIVAEKGFVGGGTPDVYYNTELGDGLDLGGGNLGGPFQIVLHNNFAP